MSVELADAIFVRVVNDKALIQAFRKWLDEEGIHHLARRTIAAGDGACHDYTFDVKDRLKIRHFFIDYEMREGMKVYAG